MKHIVTAMLMTATAALAADVQPVKDAGPYVPSPQSVVSDMLRYADVGPNDFLIDLGSGDGRIVLTAAKVFGARGFGVEIKEDLVKRANDAAQKEGLADRVKFLKQDLFKTDISQATTTLIYLYIVPANVAGRWEAHMPPAISKQPAALTLKQQLTRVSGSLRLDGRDVALEDVRLRGDQLSFRLVGHKGAFSGVVKGGAIEGTFDGKTPWSATLGG
jgi:hypothetical protein